MKTTRTKWKRRFWTPAELLTLRKLYPDTPTAKIAEKFGSTIFRVYRMASNLGLHKSEAFKASPASGRTTGRQGVGSRFEKGHKPFNAGLKGWQAGGRAKETQFKANRLPHNTVPIGTERISKDGYLERKWTDATGTPRDWRGVHILTWEWLHGPLPKGHAIVFKDGNRKNHNLENLEIISRADLMRRNTIHRYPVDLKKTIRSLAKLNRTIRKKNEKQN